jgi:hypothetical protein
MAPAALSAIVRRGPFAASAETGCGGSTIVFSHLSTCHLAFAIEGTDRTISSLRAHPDMRAGAVTFHEGETKRTLPAHEFREPLDFVLLDGPHAYPLPQLEFVYLFPHLRLGGHLAIDDIQIPAVHDLFRFLKAEKFVKLDAVVVRTALFRKVAASDLGPDNWMDQTMNRRGILRYSWRDVLRRAMRSY